MFLQILLILLFVFLGIVGLLALCLLFVAVCSLFADRNKVYDKDSAFFRFLLVYSTAIARVLLRIKIKTTGLEKIPEGRFLLVCNHRSKFDPILTWLELRKYKLAFISKPENFKVPIYGRIIRKCCFMAIDRENPRNAAKTINQAAKLLSGGEVSVAVYPEGTRNTEKELLPFHNAVFKSAIKAKVPVVIMTVKGTDDIHKKYPLRRSVVKMDILDTISAEKVAKMKTAEIGDYAYEIMSRNLKSE